MEAVRDCPADCDKCAADPVCCDEPDGLARDLSTALLAAWAERDLALAVVELLDELIPRNTIRLSISPGYLGDITATLANTKGGTDV